jgi:hypothetical protein
MKRFIGLALLMIAGPVAAQKVTIDYAKGFDFKNVKTFEYAPTEKTDAKDPLMNDRIVGLIKQKLTEDGLKEVDENPDIYVTYHMTTKENTVFNTTGFGYGGFGPGWGGWGLGVPASSTTTESTYTEGTLIFDAYDAQDKKLVWRGTGTVTVSDKPDKQTKDIEKIVDKLGDRWKKILRAEGE